MPPSRSSSPGFLDAFICNRGKPVLIMSHLVLGYPSLAENRLVIDEMVAGGVDLLELQIPFSEPIADGPVIVRANQESLNNGFRVADGMRFIAEVIQRHPIPILIMTYYNILFAYGVEAFIREAARMGVKGLIIPDLPLEEADAAMGWCRKWGGPEGLAWIQLMTPTCTDERLAIIGDLAQGFCYCVARKGVTGKTTQFGGAVDQFLQRCRKATSVPLAVGFGVKKNADVRGLTGLAEVAVVGSAAMEIHRTAGVRAVGRFFSELRQAVPPPVI